jgi:GT2 family glycosyltransferase
VRATGRTTGIDLSFIVATRDRREPLMRCLASIEAQRYPSMEIIVADDASSDGTGDAVRSRFPGVRYVRLDEHTGIGRALDAGSREASGDVWINLDDDCLLVSPDAAGLIARRFVGSPELAALCFRVEAPDGSIRRREIPRRDKRLPSTETELAYFLGGAVAYRASDLKSAGGYATDIGYASEDLDAAFRLFRAGYRMLFTPEVRVVHLAIPSPENTREREANYARSRIRIAARYLPPPYAEVHALLWTVRCLALAATRGHLAATWSAVMAAVGDWPELRADGSRRLSTAQTRRMSRLSGRTWY